MRIYTIVLTDLTSDKLKADEDLERLINNKDIEAMEKSLRIRNKLKEIVLIEQSISTWRGYKKEDDVTKEEEETNKE